MVFFAAQKFDRKSVDAYRTTPIKEHQVNDENSNKWCLLVLFAIGPTIVAAQISMLTMIQNMLSRGHNIDRSIQSAQVIRQQWDVKKLLMYAWNHRYYLALHGKCSVNNVLDIILVLFVCSAGNFNATIEFSLVRKFLALETRAARNISRTAGVSDDFHIYRHFHKSEQQLTFVRR